MKQKPKTISILSIICDIIHVFYFSFIFFPFERLILRQKQNGQLIYYINEFTNRFVSEFFWNFLWEVDANCLFVIIKGYVKVHFKENNNIDNNNNNNNNNNNSGYLPSNYNIYFKLLLLVLETFST